MGNESEDGNERAKSALCYPDNERGRKVWAEVYPGGDMQIELDGIYGGEELYLSPGEPEALLEILIELVGEERQYRGWKCANCGSHPRLKHEDEPDHECRHCGSDDWYVNTGSDCSGGQTDE